jgi:spore maturation protein CgeB
VIERFFEPNKEFVYFEEGKLQETIDKVLANYDDYQPIIENAYRRAVKEYTTKAFFEKYLKKL